mmetsp:Transcript_11287/g.28536  ORF Transcript_11287/g.28536 Transcript_11287/m.28536 type:complete len:257 (-) Transcript_11287:656-1426(-)
MVQKAIARGRGQSSVAMLNGEVCELPVRLECKRVVHHEAVDVHVGAGEEALYLLGREAEVALDQQLPHGALGQRGGLHRVCLLENVGERLAHRPLVEVVHEAVRAARRRERAHRLELRGLRLGVEQPVDQVRRNGRERSVGHHPLLVLLRLGENRVDLQPREAEVSQANQVLDCHGGEHPAARRVGRAHHVEQEFLELRGGLLRGEELVLEDLHQDLVAQRHELAVRHHAVVVVVDLAHDEVDLLPLEPKVGLLKT